MVRRMNYSGWVVVLAVAAGLGACDRASDEAPRAPAARAPAASSTPDPTPKAAEVYRETAPPEKTSKHVPTDPLGPMSKEEEETAMPKAGQANDHSNPVAQPPKPQEGSRG